jgi:heme-degrading monooxygenase HmoA
MTEIEPGREIVAALTLVRYPPRAAYVALVRMGIDRLRLRRTPGLRFWKLLGTAHGATFGRWNPRRYGLLTVWDSRESLEAFEQGSPVMNGYRRHADEMWTVHLAPVRWRGKWSGRDPFAGAIPAAAPTHGPWAILTRATIDPRRLHAFRAAARPVDATLAGREGLLASIGLGEAPLITQATFSLWSDLSAVQEFAYGGARHAEAIRRTRAERWYVEELFARFQPIASYGTWDRVDPLQDTECKA